MKTNMNITLAFIGLAAFACNDDDNKGPLNGTDKPFVENAALGNHTEIQFGELAASKGTDPSVIDFGKQMRDEHSEALIELETIADDYDNINLPTTMDAMHLQIYQQLQSLSGEKFDSAYIKSQVDDHKKTVALFENETNNGVEQRVKAYANKYLPHIRMHLNRADSIETVLFVKRITG